MKKQKTEEQLKIEERRKELKKEINLLQIALDFLRQILGIQTQIEKLQIQELITKIAEEYGVDPLLALQVAQCESGFNPRATNKKGNTPSWSVDRGLYMWNDYWHPEISDQCAFNPECATKKFCEAVKNGKLHWWSPSKSCWSK